MNEDVRFNASKSYRVCTALGACLLSIFLVGILGEHLGASMYGIPFGIAIGLYFTYPVYIVKADSLVFKFGFGKQTFPFSQGPFRVERLTGFKSYMQSFRPQSHMLRVTGAKNRGIAMTLPDGDLAALLGLLRERGAVVEGDIAGLS